MKCPNCNTEILQEQINISADIAQCSSCKNIFKISENLEYSVEAFDITTPPSGTWIIKDLDQTIIGASTRSPIAFFLVPFMLVWSGGSLGGIYGTQILSGEFNWFLSLFGIPFLLGSLLFWTFTLMAIWGKVEVTINNSGGKIFTGIGNIGIRSQFNWDEVSTIKEALFNIKYPGSQGGKIVIEGKKRISFGSGLNQSRSYYMLKSLQQIFAQSKTRKNRNTI